MNTAVIVLGMHRSGTSLLAEIVARWGAFGGHNHNLMAADDGNQRGYWEYIPLVQFNEALLAQVNANWFVPPDNDEILYQMAWEPRLRKPANALIADMAAGGRTWYWKDPRLAVLLPFWHQIWQQVVYIIPVRHPFDIAMSIKKRNNFPVSAALLIWQYYMLAVLRHTSTHPGVLFVEYEQLVSNPEKECLRVCAFLDHQCGAVENNETATENMMQAVTPLLQHHQNQQPLAEQPMATPGQVALYQLLKEKCLNADQGFVADDYPIYPGWREYLLTVNALVSISSQTPCNAG